MNASDAADADQGCAGFVLGLVLFVAVEAYLWTAITFGMAALVSFRSALALVLLVYLGLALGGFAAIAFGGLRGQFGRYAAGFAATVVVTIALLAVLPLA